MVNKKLRNTLKLLSFGSVLLMTGCAITPKTTSDYDTAYNFAHLKLYAWVESSNEKVSTLDDKRQKNAIETILNQKGFKLAKSTAAADFLLKTHVITDKKVDVDRFFQTWGYHPFYNPNLIISPYTPWPRSSHTQIREYQVGTLVVDIVDPKLKQVIWRASIEKDLGIYKNRTPEERATIAMSNAQHLLKSFPPKPISNSAD